jgi:hypothetical protein
MNDLIIFILMMLVICGLVIGGAYLWESTSCEQQANQMGFSHNYNLVKGCMIKVNQTWVPLDNYRYFGD